MKLLPNISSKQYNDVEWVLKYLQDNPVIGDENVEPIENFHCFWKGVINDLHAVSLDSLFNTVPHICVMNTKSENCEYSNMVISSRNCYLNFGCVENENCDYGHIVWNSRDSIDNLYIYKSEIEGAI